MGQFRKTFIQLISYAFLISVVVFGVYLVYEKVLLALYVGETEQRIGLIQRASEPFLFWVSVTIDGVLGLLVTIFGIFLFFRILNKNRES